MKTQILAFIVKHKELSLFVVIALVTYTFTSCKATPTQRPTIGEQRTDDMATFIPAGHSLVPIEIANYQTLDSIFGSFGVVDLYVQDTSASNYSRLVAQFVKIVRAPKNPSHFAALVPHQEIKKLMKYTGPFFVVIQNSKISGTAFENETLEKKKIKSRIQYNIGE
jgi:hypothetical protein